MSRKRIGLFILLIGLLFGVASIPVLAHTDWHLVADVEYAADYGYLEVMVLNAGYWTYDYRVRAHSTDGGWVPLLPMAGVELAPGEDYTFTFPIQLTWDITEIVAYMDTGGECTFTTYWSHVTDGPYYGEADVQGGVACLTQWCSWHDTSSVEVDEGEHYKMWYKNEGSCPLTLTVWAHWFPRGETYPLTSERISPNYDEIAGGSARIWYWHPDEDVDIQYIQFAVNSFRAEDVCFDYCGSGEFPGSNCGIGPDSLGEDHSVEFWVETTDDYECSLDVDDLPVTPYGCGY